MFDSRGLPDYPPPHNAWQFPPPPISRRWKWVAIAAMVVGFVAGTTMMVVIGVVGARGAPGLIDDPRLVSVIEDECETMTRSVAVTPVRGDARQQSAAISRQNAAIEEMVESIRRQEPERVADDRPAEAWLADWERLVEAREAYARRLLREPLPDLDIPQDERGEDIDMRMSDVFVEESTCEVPISLVVPAFGRSSDV